MPKLTNVVTKWNYFETKKDPNVIKPIILNEKLNYDQSVEDFKMSKRDVKSALEELLRRYNDFTNDVSPKYWRTTGSHITYLKNILEEIERFEPISKEEKEIDWVKKARLNHDD